MLRRVKPPGAAYSLVRVRPPTLAQMEQRLPEESVSIIHFMGHSGSAQGKSVLVFENQLANSQHVDAATLISALNDQVFLVILNSCLSSARAFPLRLACSLSSSTMWHWR